MNGACSPSDGHCNCAIGYWGDDCSNTCPQTNGMVCSGHGSCGTNGNCTCNTPYTGTDCSLVFCPYDCYDHGSCDEFGVCHCQGNWEGIYCSTEKTQPPIGGAQFTFISGYIRTEEDAGTIFLNVSRGGNTYGDVYVSYATQDASAHAYSDYMPTDGLLAWSSGDSTPQSIQVDILGDDHPEGVEAFTVFLYAPSPGSTVGSNATIAISANGDSVSSVDNVVVTVLISKSESELRLTTVTGATFADTFINNLADVDVLDIPSDRIVVRSVESRTSSESYYTFVLLGSSTGPSGDDLAEIIWTQMHDMTSALYAGSATQYIDMNYQPVFKFTEPADQGSPTTYWWLLAVGIVLLVLVAVGVVLYKKRLAVVEWLLWRLGNMRFSALMKHRNLDDLTESPPATGPPTRPDQSITDDRL